MRAIGSLGKMARVLNSPRRKFRNAKENVLVGVTFARHGAESATKAVKKFAGSVMGRNNQRTELDQQVPEAQGKVDIVGTKNKICMDMGNTEAERRQSVAIRVGSMDKSIRLVRDAEKNDFSDLRSRLLAWNKDGLAPEMRGSGILRTFATASKMGLNFSTAEALKDSYGKEFDQAIDGLASNYTENKKYSDLGDVRSLEKEESPFKNEADVSAFIDYMKKTTTLMENVQEAHLKQNVMSGVDALVNDSDLSADLDMAMNFGDVK